MIKCTECGYENMDGLDYCDGCGAKLASAAPPASSGVSSPAAGSGPAAPAGSGPTTIDAPPTPADPVKGEAIEAPHDHAHDQHPAESKPAESAPSAMTHIEEPPKPDAPTGDLNKPAAPAAAPSTAPSGAAVAFKAKFIVVRGGRKGQEFPLEEGNNLIGRWDPETGSFPEVDLDADDPEAKISRKHALARIDGGKITVEDIGSLNGTYVNRGTRLNPGSPADIKSGDEIIIGKTFLKLVVEPHS